MRHSSFAGHLDCSYNGKTHKSRRDAAKRPRQHDGRRIMHPGQCSIVRRRQEWGNRNSDGVLPLHPGIARRLAKIQLRHLDGNE